MMPTECYTRLTVFFKKEDNKKKENTHKVLEERVC